MDFMLEEELNDLMTFCLQTPKSFDTPKQEKNI